MQAVAGKGEEDIVTTLRRTAGDTLQQMGITPRVEAMQGKQVAAAVDAAHYYIAAALLSLGGNGRSWGD